MHSCCIHTRNTYNTYRHTYRHMNDLTVRIVHTKRRVYRNRGWTCSLAGWSGAPTTTRWKETLRYWDIENWDTNKITPPSLCCCSSKDQMTKISRTERCVRMHQQQFWLCLCSLYPVPGTSLGWIKSDTGCTADVVRRQQQPQPVQALVTTLRTDNYYNSIRLIHLLQYIVKCSKRSWMQCPCHRTGCDR